MIRLLIFQIGWPSALFNWNFSLSFHSEEAPSPAELEKLTFISAISMNLARYGMDKLEKFQLTPPLSPKISDCTGEIQFIPSR